MIDEKRAGNAIKFVRLLTHTKGEFARRKFNLLPFQEQILRDLLGTVDEQGYRQYREAFVFMGRKNGKTELLSAIVLYFLFMEKEYGQELVAAANTREQAGILFNAVATMIRNDSVLSGKCRIIDSQKRVVRYDTNSFFKAISADQSTADGMNLNLCVYDEIHEAKDRQLYDKLITSMGGRRNPLMVSITTAGYDKQSICYQLYDYSKRIINGSVEDSTFYPVIYEADHGCDIMDEKQWQKANPALGVFRNEDELRKTAKRALEIPSLENSFRRLYLNQWTSAETRWMSLDKWQACGGEIYPDLLVGRRCWGGLDLASTTDITAFVLAFEPEEDGIVPVLSWFWVPEENIHDRAIRDRVPYDVWQKEGFVNTTPGNVADYRQIRQDINDLGDQFAIQEIGHDPWNGTQLTLELDGDGFTMVPIRQGFASMSAPTKHLEGMILGQKLNHGDNPVLAWMFDNVQLKIDPAGNIKVDKGKSREKVDGIVALIMAIDRLNRAVDDGRSVYEDQDIFVL